MPFAHLCPQLADHLPQSLRFIQTVRVFLPKDAFGNCQHPQHRPGKNLQFLLRLGRKSQLLLFHLTISHGNARRVIRDPFEIPDTVQIQSQRTAVLLRKILSRQFQQIRTDHILITVHILFQLPDAFRRLFRITVQQAYGLLT